MRGSAGAFIDGLLSGVSRKTGWQLAEQARLTAPYRIQSLLGRSSWDANTLRDLVRGEVLESLGDAGGVLVVDETCFLKKGKLSVGVARQYSGTARQVENCRIGIFLGYASCFGQALIDRRLYLPKSCAADGERLQRVGVPQAVAFATKPQIAAEMTATALAAGIRPAFVLADPLHGACSSIRHMQEARCQPYVLAAHSKRPRLLLGLCTRGYIACEFGRGHQLRWTIEECFQRAKEELGLDHCEARSWHGWHRRMTLCMAADAFSARLLAQLRRAAQGKPNKTSPTRDPTPTTANQRTGNSHADHQSSAATAATPKSRICPVRVETTSPNQRSMLQLQISKNATIVLGNTCRMKPLKTIPARDFTEGLRERKRRQTRKAIADAGLRLFLKNGYDETTLDEIAATVDIARRTFFSYFESKEDLVLTGVETGISEALRTAFNDVSPKTAPFEAVRAELSRLVSQFESKYSIAVFDLMRSSEALRRRKLGVWVKLEQNLFEGLQAVWSDERETELRMVAMVGIGVMRVSMDTWWRERGKCSPSTYVREGFATLKSHV